MEHGGVGGAGVGVSVGQPGVERGARGESEARPRGVERDALEVGGAEGVAVEGRRGGRSQVGRGSVGGLEAGSGADNGGGGQVVRGHPQKRENHPRRV